jgi:hypothetical protein
LSTTLPAARESGARNLRVREIEPHADPRWDAFVTNHAAGLVYLHSTWLSALAHEYGQPIVGLACEDATGHLRGVLPLMLTRGLPGARLLPAGSEPRLASLPRTPIAGPLADGPDATSLLLGEAIDRIEQFAGHRLQLKTEQPGLDAFDDRLVCAPWRSTYRVDLSRGASTLRFGDSRNHARIKWAVGKASRSGVTVREATSQGDLKAWYRLYLDVNRWHALPARSFRFFDALWQLLRPAGLSRLLIAEQRSGTGHQLLAGSFILQLGRTAFYAFNGRLREGLPFRPNDLIQWHAIHQAAESGCSVYDLGEVEVGNVGLAAFKTKWGATEHPLYRCYYPAPRRLDPGYGAMESEGRAVRAGRAVWRRVPLGLTEALGGLAYRYL